MLCHCACKHVRLSCVLNKLLTYLLTYLKRSRRRDQIKVLVVAAEVACLELNFDLKHESIIALTQFV